MPKLLIHNPQPPLTTTSCSISPLPSIFSSKLVHSFRPLPRCITGPGSCYSRGNAKRDCGSVNLMATRSIVCMANPRRVKMVAKQIRRELSDMLLTDKVLQTAVLPEAALGADRYLSSLTTISDVEVSADLQVVKVYVSVFGDDRGKEVAIAGLKSKAKYVRGELGRRMKLRLTPEIRFIEDESLERGSRVIAILDKIKDENAKKFSNFQPDDERQSSDQSEDDEEWEGDDPDDEGIIYVQ